MSNLLEQASLVMIPSGYKEDVVYSQIPTSGAGDLSFTRASNGTRVNSAGLVEVCPWNLITYSEEFTNSVWAKYNGTTITANTTTAPNGTLTADTLEKLGGSGGSNYYYAVTTTNSFEQLTNFFYVKHKSGSGIVWLLGKNSGTFAFFDVINGTALSKSSGMTTSIESVGNGWYKCIFSQSYVGASSTEFGIGLCLVDGTPNYDATSAATQSVYIWGAQSAVGSTAKPYFPTTDRLNVPRLTYQNGGGGCPSLLLEKQSTNGIYPSEDFTNANWQNYGGASVTANTAISPDGTQNADTLDSGTTTALYNPNGVSGGAIPFTASIYVKKVNFEVFRFGMTDDTLEEFSYNYNLDTGAISSASSPTVWTNTSGTITSVGNGWYRLTVTGTKGVAGVARMVVKGQSSSKQYYIWGAQVEASSYATSYIPTTSSSATRVADACFKTGISSLIGQTEGSVFFDFTVDTISAQTNDPVLWYMKDGDAGERYIELYSNGNLAYVEYTTLTISSIIKSGLTVGRHKCAIAYATDDFVFYVDGVQVGTDTNGTPNAYSTFGLQYYNSAYLGHQKVNQAAIFKTRLTNAELASLTTI